MKEKNLEHMVDEKVIRMIPDIQYLDGSKMMGVHEYMETLPTPALMLGHFNPVTVTIGKYVDIASISDACKQGKIPFTRRPSSGKILCHLEKDVVYACSGIKSMFEIMDLLSEGLRSAGIETTYEGGTSTLVSDKQGVRKIAGSAPHKAITGCRMMHGSIFYDHPDFNVLEQAYGVPAAELQKKITCVREQQDVPIEEFYAAIRSAFAQGRRVIETPFTDDEWGKINELSRKYASTEYLQGSGALKDSAPCASTWAKHPGKATYMPERLRKRLIRDS